MDIEIDPADLKALLGTTSSVVLLDVREPWECQVARIEAAKHIPMGQVPSRAHAELDPESHIVAICHHGVRSLSVTSWLRQRGFDNVQSLRGGIDAWSHIVDPKIPTY